MGVVTMRNSKMAAIAADRDKWMRQATAASIAAMKDVIGVDGPIRVHEPIGRLSDSEWGWLCSSSLWAWIACRAEQAASEGWNEEVAVRTTGLEPDPWRVGAVVGVLPKLAEAYPELDWSQPVGAWSKDAIAEFLLAAFDLIQRAFAARDVAEERVAGKTNADVVARQMNAAAGNPRMTVAELKQLDDDIPF
jgi:hypothetical protein